MAGYQSHIITLLIDNYSTDRAEGEYLTYVKSLAGTWPQLQLLVDFMEVGTIPTRWCTFPGEVPVKNQKPRYVYGDTIPGELSPVFQSSSHV